MILNIKIKQIRNGFFPLRTITQRILKSASNFKIIDSLTIVL